MNVHSPPDEVERAVGANGRSLRILVVHEHDVVRLGFRLMLSQAPCVRRCIGARDADEAIALWNRYEPNVALVDLLVGETPGTDLCRLLLEVRSHGRVLLMSGTESITSASVAASGASGFISTGAPAHKILNAIMVAADGKTISPVSSTSNTLLSAQQRAVLRLMALGATNREIAAALYLSPHTVKGHTAKLYRRLDVRNRTEAVRQAQLVGLIA